MKTILDYITKKEESPFKDLAVLLVVFGLAAFQFLGRIPLLEPDEGRYAEIPREMLEKFDFITPYLNYVKYFEKPPLLYWLNSLSFTLFGQNEFAARFFPALSGLLCILFVYFLGRNIFGRREGLISALILGTSVGFIPQARMNIIDMLLTFCLTAAVGFFFLSIQEGENRKRLYLNLFYFFAALAVLAKGLVGIVLPAGIILSYILVTRRWRLLMEIFSPAGVLLFFATAAPWFVLVSLHNPEFPRFFFYHEHFERFLTKVHGRYQPLWYFIPVLLGCMFPWSLFIPSVGRQVRLELRSPHRNKHLFLLLWAGIIFVFFSVSDSKLIPYILPVFPPVALLLGRMFCTAFENENYNLRLASTVAGFLIILAGVGISLYPVVASKPKLGPLATGLVGGVLVAGGVAALVLRKSEGIRATIAVYAATALIVLTAAPYFVFGRLADNKTTPEFAPIIMKDFGKRDKIACYRFYQQAMPFLTGKRVILVDYKGELEFGSEQADSSSWFIDETRFSRLWNSPPRMFVVVKEHDLDRLRAGVGTAVRVLAKKGEIYLVSNR